MTFMEEGIKPFQEIAELQSIISPASHYSPANPAPQSVSNRASELIEKLQTAARGLSERINRDALQELDNLNYMIGIFLGIQMIPPTPAGPQTATQLAILGSLEKLTLFSFGQPFEQWSLNNPNLEV